MAIRHCIELGYHRSVKRVRPNTDVLTREMSKRIFWVAYDIDRAAAFTLGRPFGISDQMIDVEVCRTMFRVWKPPWVTDSKHIHSFHLTSTTAP